MKYEEMRRGPVGRIWNSRCLKNIGKALARAAFRIALPQSRKTLLNQWEMKFFRGHNRKRAPKGHPMKGQNCTCAILCIHLVAQVVPNGAQSACKGSQKLPKWSQNAAQGLQNVGPRAPMGGFPLRYIYIYIYIYKGHAIKVR